MPEAEPVKHLLRVAGVNIHSVLTDTTQLSVCRGGSLLLRQAIKDIQVEFRNFKPISTGASEGLFELEGDTEEARKKVLDFLAQSPNYMHFTFVVDVVPCKLAPGFELRKEAVISLNRQRQFQQLTTVLPLAIEENTTPCRLDNLRPADPRSKVGLSKSVAARMDYGRDMKQAFFSEELDSEFVKLKLTQNLHQIAYNPDFGNLSNKLAVIYFDGNGFSKILRGCNDTETIARFDTELQIKRKAYLSEFVRWAKCDPAFWNKDLLRLEILLWGGDEMTLVVPAWRGLATLSHFFSVSVDWSFELNSKTHSLTHAGGLVFCQVKTPIGRVQTLARDLAERVKESPDGRKQNGFDYMVLESVDFPTQSVEDASVISYGNSLTSYWKPLQPIPVSTKINGLLATLFHLPRRQVYRTAVSILPGGDYEAAKVKFKKLIGQRQWNSAICDMKSIFGNTQSEKWLWVHLVELWDYLNPSI